MYCVHTILFMGLIKRGKVWWIRFEYNGQLIQRTPRSHNKDIARDIEAQLRARLARGEAGLIDTAHAPTLDKFGQRFLAHLPAHVAPRTVGFYTDAWKPLRDFPVVACAKISAIDEALIEQFVRHRLKDKVAISTVNHTLRTLRRALRLAVEWKLIYRPPKIKLLPGERQREFIISEELLAKILSFASPTMQRLLPFLIDTGLRVSESLDLTWSAVSTEPKEGAKRGWLYVARGKSKYVKRYVPLTARAASIVEECKKYSKGQWVFPAYGGKEKLSRWWPSEQFHHIARKLKLPRDCVLHSTRHSFCTRLGEAGCGAFEIQRLAGHSSITISQRYVHPTPSKLENAIGVLQAYTISNTPKASVAVSN